MSEENRVLIHGEQWQVLEESPGFVCEVGDCTAAADYYLMCLEGEHEGRIFCCADCLEKLKEVEG